jgi:signal transduction histidine kinase
MPMQLSNGAPSREARAEAQRAVRSLRIALGMSGLVLALFTLLVALYSWNAVQVREQRYMVSLAEVTGRSMDAYFVSLETALAGLRREIADAGGHINTPAVAPAMRRFKDAYPDISLVLVARMDGSVLASSNPEVTRPDFNLDNVPGFAQARREFLAGRNLSVGQPVRGLLTGELIIPVRYAARDARGQPVLVIAAALPTARPQSFWHDVPLPENAALSLIHADGHVLSRHPVPRGMLPEEVFGLPISPAVKAHYQEHALVQDGTFEAVSRITGERSLIAFQRLEHYPLIVQVINPKINAWREWWRDTQMAWVLTLGLVLAGSLIYRTTVRRQAAWELERSQRLLELTRAKRELEDFTYTVSHDLRAPLRAVDGYAAILGEELGSGLPESQAHALAKIRDSAQRMGQLIDGLLAFSQRSRQALQKRDVDVHRMVQGVLAEVIPPHARIRITVGVLPRAHADLDALRQVWLNLLANAVKFGSAAAQPAIEIGYERARGAYFVRDNGPGFEMAYAKSLFAVFSHTNSAGEYDGSGVGLATVARIIERHGGTVWAESAPGEGAAFFFTLERALAQSVSAAAGVEG